MLHRKGQNLIPYLLLLPLFAFLGVFVLYPAISNFYLSFYDYALLRPNAKMFIGIKNYTKALTDPRVLNSIKVTLIYGVSAVSLQYCLGLGMALLLNHITKFRRIAQSIVLLPLIVMPTVIGMMWKLILNTDWGVINYLLSTIGVSKVNWLGNGKIALFSIIMVEVWNNTPFVVLVLFAALRALPVEPFESAQIDGANSFQILRHVTLPLLKPATLVVLTFRTIYVLRTLAHIFSLTSGGPGYSTSILALHIYQTGFKQYQIGYASALSVILMVITCGIGLVYFRKLYSNLEV